MRNLCADLSYTVIEWVSQSKTFSRWYALTRNGKHCHAIVEHTLRLVSALFTQVARKKVRDTAQLFLEILARIFTPRNPTHTVCTDTSNSIIGTQNG